MMICCKAASSSKPTPPDYAVTIWIRMYTDGICVWTGGLNRYISFTSTQLKIKLTSLAYLMREWHQLY